MISFPVNVKKINDAFVRPLPLDIKWPAPKTTTHIAIIGELGAITSIHITFNFLLCLLVDILLLRHTSL